MGHIIKQASPFVQKAILSTSCTKNITKILGYNRWCSTKAVTDLKGRQIYSGMLTSQIKSVKVFSLTTSMAGIIGQPLLYKQIEQMGALASGAAMCFVGFFTFVTPVLLHLVTKKYVIAMHYNDEKDTYTATTLTLLLTKREIEFKQSDVVIPDVPGMFTTFLAKGVPLFIEPKQFSDPDQYIKLMGFDKPIDFKLNLDADEYKKTKQT